MLLMTIKEYAESRNVSAKRLRALIAAGKIAAGRESPKSKWLLNVSKVDAYFEELTMPKARVATYIPNKDFRAGLKARLAECKLQAARSS